MIMTIIIALSEIILFLKTILIRPVGLLSSEQDIVVSL